MASRPRRGKQMSLMIPPTPQPREETDSESDNEMMEEEEVAEEVEEEEEEEVIQEQQGVEESSGSENSPKGKTRDIVLVEGQQRQLRQRQQQSQQAQRIRLPQKRKARQVLEESDEHLESEEDFRPPPTPRVALPHDRLRDADRELTPLNIREPQEVSKIYGELIDACHNLENDTGFDENFQDVMSKNIKKGHALFKHLMKGSMGPSADEFDGDEERRTIGGPGDMYLAFLHTKISSNIIRNRAERIGSGASIFSVDAYLNSLKREFVDEDIQYNPKLAAANIAMQTSIGTKAVMPLVAVVGTFDRDAVIIPKIKKPRQPIRRMVVEEQQDNANDDPENNMQLVQQNSGAENLAKEMNKILKTVYRQKPEPVNIFEFVMDRTSFPRTVENIFYLSFLVKDGHVSLNKDDNGKFKDLSLNIKPEKSQRLETSAPDEGETSRNQTHRQKYILSFSPRMWKSMCNMSEGQDVISFYQRLMDGTGQSTHQYPAIKYSN